VADWVVTVIDRLGPVGVGLLIALETVVPPIPSELILPLAGFRARSGAMHPVTVWAAATVGAVLGALALYGLGARLGYRRLHRLAGRRWFFLASQDDLERGRRLFERHGSWVVAAARCVPVLRSLVSLPAGVAGMPLPKFTLLTAVGAGVWNAAFIAAGWLLAEKWREVDRYAGPAGVAMTVAVVAGLAVLAWRRSRSTRTRADAGASRVSTTAGERR
jgi:membrane protein DedA with SNARE-associated domain